MPALWLFTLMACKSVDPAPKQLDDLVHYFWNEFEDGSDEELAAALLNLNAAVNANREELLDGSLTKLTRPELKTLQKSPGEPKNADGVFLARPMDCSLNGLNAIFAWPAQDELYEGVYDSYIRDYLDSREDYLSGESDTLSFDIVYGATTIGVSYEGNLRGALRRVDAIDADLTPYGEFVISRFYAMKPADFGDSSNKSLTQDYQIEVFWNPKKGRTFHVYGLWREANFGVGLTSDDESVQRLTLNNMDDWDDGTDEICAAGLP